MKLADLSIPPIPLPIEIAEHLHPYIIHFAIVIPVIVLLLEVYNIAARRPSISLFSLFLLILMALIFFGAYLTGDVDGKATMALLSEVAKSDLQEHKQIGILLLYASAIILALKILLMPFKQGWAIGLFLTFLSVFVFIVLYQGKTGDVLVYEHGANIEKVQLLTTSSSQIKAVEIKVEEELKAVNSANTTLKNKNNDLTKRLIETTNLKEKAEKALFQMQREVNLTIEIASEEAKQIRLKAKENNQSIIAKAKEKSTILEQEAQILLDQAKKRVQEFMDQAKEANQTIVLNAQNDALLLRQKAQKILEKAKEHNATIFKNVEEEKLRLEKEKKMILDNARTEAEEILAQATQLIIENAKIRRSALHQLLKTTEDAPVDKKEENSTAVQE